MTVTVSPSATGAVVVVGDDDVVVLVGAGLAVGVTTGVRDDAAVGVGEAVLMSVAATTMNTPTAIPSQTLYACRTGLLPDEISTRCDTTSQMSGAALPRASTGGHRVATVSNIDSKGEADDARHER
ncbi:hypothetical protein ACR9E3_32290 [Actinomycetospora sp. C-140]